MNNTYLDLPASNELEELKDRMAVGYYWSKEGDKFESIGFAGQFEAIGAGCINSSVSEYAKYVRCMLGKGPPLSEESHEELVKPRMIMDPDTVPKHGRSHALYALGWETSHYHGHRQIGHDGGVPGFQSVVKFMPDLNWGIVIFNNGDEGGEELNDIIESMIIDDLIEMPVEKRLDWNQVIREQFEKQKAEDEEEEAKEDEVDDGEDLTAGVELPLEAYAGHYYNKGYHSLHLQVNEDKLVADCSDRSFGFYLDVERKEKNHFLCRLRDLYDGKRTPTKARFLLGEKSGRAIRFGVNLESTLDDLIWFDWVA